MDNLTEIKNRIKKECHKRGTTVKRMLEDLSLNAMYVSQLPTLKEPPLNTLTRIAQYLGIPVDYLLYGTVDRPTPISAREEELIRIVSQMTDEQRESLLVLLRAMQDGKH